MPSIAQFYNLIGYVKPDRFQEMFIAWFEEIVKSDERLRTISIDGKTICSTEKMVSQGQGLHISSAVISESKLILGSLPCDTKVSEPKVLRDWLKFLISVVQ